MFTRRHFLKTAGAATACAFIPARACGLELWKLLNFDEAAKEKIPDSRDALSAVTKIGRSKNKSPVNKIIKGRAKSSASNLDH